ncbi:nucleoporin autopeptidase-domain-containing protein [Spinellus fusiger]|nr:nucleoporin autopeptidase-domain-containing protein [Spinellus fusiger]
MFGKSAFGATPGFGQQPQQNQSVFGQPAQQQQTAFGGFNTGSATPGAFGQPAQSSAFGAPAANPTGFGAGTSAFGQPRASAFGSTPAFGATQSVPTTGFGGFGAAAPATGFGAAQPAQQAGGLFGQRTTTTNTFGSASTSAPSVFGAQPQQQTNAFGSMSTPAFGQTATTGSNQGTAIADFSATQDRDLSSNTTTLFQTITAMPQYKGFSFEELRLQDYMNGRKTATAAPGGFGAPAATGFGQAPKPFTFGNNAAPAANTFGAPAQTGFGQPAQTNTFGSFGQNPATSSAPATGFGFNNAFGAAATSKPTAPFSFGATSAAQPAAGTGFGFNATANPTFGAPQASQAPGMFGAQPAAPTTSLFGGAQQAVAPSFGFGQASTGFGSGGMFGQQPAASTAPGASIFGQAPTALGFGAQGANTDSFTLPAQNGLTSFGTNGLQPGQQQQFLVAQVDKDPYGKNPLFDTKEGAGSSGPSAVPVNPPKKQTPRQYPMTPRTMSRIKLRGFSFAPPMQSSGTKMSALEGISDEDVLRSGAFATFNGNRKAVFNKVTSNDVVSALLNKTAEKPKPLFNADIELLANHEAKELEKAVSAQSVSPALLPSLSAAAMSQGYYCSPTIETLLAMSKEDLSHVENFVVGRRGYGSVTFSVPVDLSSTDLHGIMGSIVIIDNKSIFLYSTVHSPPAGQELNVEAVCKIEGVYTKDKDTKTPIKDVNHPRIKSFIAKLQRQAGTTFVDYDLSTGTWIFKVDNFDA